MGKAYLRTTVRLLVSMEESIEYGPSAILGKPDGRPTTPYNPIIT
jgi:hypothetical protein